jgi:transmembrane sensor
MGTRRQDDRRAREEAAAWFTRLKQPAVNESSVDEFLAWRRAPANSDAYAEVEARWRQADRIRNDPELVHAAEAALLRPKFAVRLRRGLRRRAFPLAFAATACIAGAAAVVVILRSQPQTYATDVGAQQVVRLDDGSVLHLNTDSKVSVAFHKAERRLVLVRGEAFFEVAHDSRRPFIVKAGDARVRAVGTKFDVRRAADATSVTLVEGRVQVARDDRPDRWMLTPNQQITLDGAPASPHAADSADVTSWTTGRLRFRETPLASAVAEVNRYSRTKISLQAPEHAATRVSGVFETGDTPAFVSAVTELFDLKATEIAGRIVLEPRPAAEPNER